MTCDEVRPLLEAYAASDLAEPGDVRSHLAACAACRAELEWVERLCSVLRTAMPRRRRTVSLAAWALAAAAVLLLVVLLRPAPGLVVEGAVQVSSAVRGPWRAGAPAEGDWIRAMGPATVCLPGGAVFELSDQSVIRLGSGDVCAALESGRIRARLSDDRLRLLLPAGELRGAGAFDVTLEGDESMRTFVTLTILSGSALVTTAGGTEAVAAGATWRSQSKGEEAVRLVAAYSKALREDDSAARQKLFNRLVAGGDEILPAVDEARAAFRKAREADLAAIGEEEMRIHESTRDAAEIERRTRELYAKHAALFREMRGLENLATEIPLRRAWARGEAVLDSEVTVVRSLEVLGNAGLWKNAVKCLAEGGEKEAREMHRVLSAARTASARSLFWHRYRWDKVHVAVLTSTVHMDGSPRLDGSWDEKGVFTWKEAVAVVKIVEVGGSPRVAAVTPGASYDPNK